MSNMPKMAKSIPVDAQEGYTPVYDKSPSRQSVKHAQAGKILFGKTPKKAKYRHITKAQEGKMSNMPRWQNLNPVYAKKAIHRYVTKHKAGKRRNKPKRAK